MVECFSGASRIYSESRAGPIVNACALRLHMPPSASSGEHEVAKSLAIAR